MDPSFRAVNCGRIAIAIREIIRTSSIPQMRRAQPSKIVGQFKVDDITIRILLELTFDLVVAKMAVRGG